MTSTEDKMIPILGLDVWEVCHSLETACSFHRISGDKFTSL